MPFIRSAATKAADGVYRQMETASQYRAERAAEMAGVPVSEMADLRITNLRDNLRQGDIAAMPVDNSVTQAMAAAPATTGFQAGGVEFSGAVGTGAFPNMGARTQHMVRSHFAATGQGHASSDRPAAETQMPGYRRRV